MKSATMVVVLAGVVLAFAPTRKSDVPDFSPGEIVIRLRDGSLVAGGASPEALRRHFPTAVMEKLFQHLPSAVDVRRRFPERALRAGDRSAPPGLGNVYRVVLNDRGADVGAVARELTRDPEVVYAEPNYLYRADATTFPNDPYFSSARSWGQPYDDLWGLKKIQAPAAWKLATGKGVVVAVIDTGVDYNHADLRTNVWINPGEDLNHNGAVDSKDLNGADDDHDGFVDDIRGWDFVGGDADPMDDSGHGTHVAGTIAAIGNNQRGIIGVAFESKIMSLKSLSSTGTGNGTSAAAAIVFAANQGADVINMSWGGPASQLVADALAYASSLGVVMVAAAGNGNTDVQYTAPALNPEVIAVAATDHNDLRAGYSNWGEKISVAAPGGDVADPADANATYRNILSLKASRGWLIDRYPTLIVGRDYLRLTGTSMSAPHAAGVAALILSRQPSLDRTLARAALEGSADDLDGNGVDPYTGFGRVNAYQAVVKADQALVRPELTVGAVHPATPSVALDGPLAVAVLVKNAGRGDAGAVEVELFDGDPAAGGTLLGRQTLAAVRSGTSAPAQFYVTLESYGTHTLFAYADRRDSVAEVNELNNWNRDVVEVSPFASMEIPIAVNAGSDQMAPAVGGDDVVWQDFRNGDADIYLYDLTTRGERRITTDPSDQLLPSVSENVVVWQDHRNNHWDIYALDLASGQESRITNDPSDHTFPWIDGHRIVWEDTRNGNSDIYMFDLATGEERRITTDPSEHDGPVISGDRIVWIDHRNGNPDVYLYDLLDGQERPITTNPGKQYAATIRGDRIAWEDHRTGSAHIYLYDLLTGVERQLTAGPSNQFFPAIHGDRIVYEDDRSGSSNIYLDDLATGLARAVTSGASRHLRPGLSSAGVAWQDDRNGTWDVYLDRWSEFPRPPTNLQALGGSGRVVLDWDDDLVPSLSGYEVYRNTSPGGGWEPIAFTILPAYIDGSVVAGTPYSYRVAAVDNDGNGSGFSNEVTATP